MSRKFKYCQSMMCSYANNPNSNAISRCWFLLLNIMKYCWVPSFGQSYTITWLNNIKIAGKYSILSSGAFHQFIHVKIYLFIYLLPGIVILHASLFTLVSKGFEYKSMFILLLAPPRIKQCCNYLPYPFSNSRLPTCTTHVYRDHHLSGQVIDSSKAHR